MVTGTTITMIGSLLQFVSGIMIFLMWCACVSPAVMAFSPAATTAKPPGAAGMSAAAIPRSSSSSSSTQLHQYSTASQQRGPAIDVTDVYSIRDVYYMEEWAAQCGMQKADGVEFYSEDGSDYQLVAQNGVGAGQTVMYVPSDLVINSASIPQEFGTSMRQAEEAVANIDWISKDTRGAEYRLTLFHLMLRVLIEYEKGRDSFYFPWLNSLPRQYYNGVSMTRACFKCLPPYAGWLTSNERLSYSNYAKALLQQRGCIPLRQDTIDSDEVLKWAYNVALTRYHEVWQQQCAKVIAPMADMLNHASEPSCEITVDYDGNVNVVALRDVPAGGALTVSYGDPTNPTPIFAQYGFLPQDCTTIFCKAMHLEKRIRELGYDFSELLFYTETGEVAPKVWDVFLYDILQKSDPGAAEQFYVACINNDEATKEQYHSEYFAYTLDALKTHVYSILGDAAELTVRALQYDIETHPRVPVIVAHNQLVSQTFANTVSLLEEMG